ncbi:hypothetical protein [Ectothiorhodospira mobilis]|uniref:hypothetical protein n=1 Tax=Ectothiorhodospira mobilis TaxID=195064 RepID=UPI001906F789|nr:hypothetical protein [Ectothiorhodospira mobilis]MBK1692886.1 hypothetical protein [Ectothiorhodospira mobilis]
MEKADFATDTRYAVTLRGPGGRLQPAQLYVHQCFYAAMIARRLDGPDSGLLVKIPYEDVIRIVRTYPVAEQDRFMLPQAMLQAKLWEDRTSMATYASAPGRGK